MTPDSPAPLRDERWFDLLYRTEHAAVLAYARRRTPDPDDVVAEVFTIAWRSRERVPEPPLPWLLRTAGNVVLHSHRSLGRRARLSVRAAGLAAPAPDHADAVVEAHDASFRVRAALDTLRPADRELLRLIAWEQLDNDELAAVLQCSTSTLRVRIHRARRRLAARLEQPASATTAPVTGQENSR